MTDLIPVPVFLDWFVAGDCPCGYRAEREGPDAGMRVQKDLDDHQDNCELNQ